jgi:hypothetical protein
MLGSSLPHRLPMYLGVAPTPPSGPLFPEGYVPLKKALEVERGVTFRDRIELYRDKARTIPVNFAGYIATFEIRGYITLTEGDGLTASPINGRVDLLITDAQTLSMPPVGQLRYALMFSNVEETVVAQSGALLISNY